MVRIICLLSLLLVHGSAVCQIMLGSGDRNIYDIDSRDTTVVAVTKNSIEVWAFNKRKLLYSIEHSGEDLLSAVCFGADPAAVITGSRAGEICVWNIATGAKTVAVPAGAQGSVTSLDMDGEGRRLAAGFLNHEVRVYDSRTFREEFRFDKYSKAVTKVKFSNIPNLLASASGDGELTIHDLGANNSKTMAHYPDWIRSIAFSADTSALAFSGDGGGVRVIKTKDEWKNASPLYSMSGGSWVTSVDYHPANGDCLVSGSLSGSINITIRAGRYTKNLRCLVNAVRFLPDQNSVLYLAVATMGKGLIILPATDMKFGRGTPHVFR